MTLGSTIGILIGTVVAGPAGAAVGGMLGEAVEALTGDILTSLGTDAVVETARSTRRRWRPAQRVASETLQSVFRAAVCEALYDIGGHDAFRDQWLTGRQVPSGVVYWQTEQGQRLRAVDRDLAERAENCFHALEGAVRDQSLFTNARGMDIGQQPVLSAREAAPAETSSFAPLIACIDHYLEDQFEMLRQELSPYQFEQHLHTQVASRVPFHLAELLRQRPEAWRDYQRLLLDTIRDIVIELATDQETLHDRQNEVISRIDQLLRRPDPAPLLLDIQAAVRTLEGVVATEGQEIRQALHQEVVGPVVEQITTRLGSTQSALEEHISSLRPALSVFVSKDVYFQPLLQERRLFSHTEELVGRTALLEQLLSLTLDGQKVMIVQGRGGIGKSRLLLEFARRLEQDGSEGERVFLADGLQLNESNVGSLLSTTRLVVIDDAHRRTDLSLLYAFLQEHRTAVQLVLATRPHAIDRIVSDLLRARYDTSQIVRLPILRELSRDDARVLAARLLGNENSRMVDRLVAITRDSPLVMILGARLLADRAIDPLLLERDNDFRARVVQTFEDVLLGNLGEAVDAQLSKRLLPVIAAVAPFPIADQGVLQTTAMMLGTTIPTLVQTIEGLERVEALQRRGGAVRIVPDTLSDHILHCACITEGGQLTGYAQSLYQTFITLNPGRLLANLAELDWRVRQTTEHAPDVLGSIWSDIVEQFRAATHESRCHMIDLLGDVAYYQPERTLNLVRIALQEPGQDQATVGWRQYTNTDVLQRLPKLLRYVAYTIPFLSQCYDLLWRLGMDDNRPTNQYPDHAIRVLTELAGYDIEKPWIYQEAAVDAVQRWLHRADAHDHVHSPLEVLDALLVKTAVSDHSDGRTVYMTAFAIPYTATHAIRRRSLDIIAECGRAVNLKVVLRAIESLSHTLHPPLPYFDMVITDDLREQWHPEETLVMDIFAQLIEETTHPVVQLRCSQALVWHARNSVSETLRRRAREIIERVPETFELQLTKVLGFSHNPIWLLEDTDDSEHQHTRREERRNQYCRAVASQLIDDYAQPVDAVEVLNHQLEMLQQLGIQTNPLGLFMAISDLSPSFAEQLCQYLIEQPSNYVTPFFAWLLLGVRKTDVSTALALQRRALDSGNQELCLSQVHCYWWNVWLDDLRSEDLVIVEGLLRHPVTTVNNAAIGVLMTLGRSQPAFAIQAAMTVEVGEDIGRASELCSVFDSHHGVSIALLNHEQRSEILNKLIPVKDIGDYQIGTFLQLLSAQSANLVFNFFQARIRYCIEHHDPNYRAVPFEHSIPELVGLDSHPDYRGLLREVRDRSLEGTGMNALEYADLFRIVSLNYNHVSLDVLQEWFDSEEENKLIGAARLLREAPRGFLFSNLDYAERVLEQAYVLGDDCFSQVAHYVSYCEVYGSRSGTPGQPFPEDVQLRAQAQTALQRLSPTSPIRSFYDGLVATAERNMRDSIARDEELFEE